MAPSVEERRLRMLISKKERFFNFFQKLFDLSKNLDEEQSRKKFFNLVGALESSRTEFFSIVDEVTLLSLELDEKFVPNYEVLDTIEEMCGQIRSAESSRNGGLEQGRIKNDTAFSESSSPRLPKIELPYFSGDLREWESFYDLFKTLIHDNGKLSKMDKLYYLMGCLRGEAKNVCAGLTMSADNYEILWEALIQRYHDTRALANSYLDQILGWRDSKEESEKGLNSFLDKFDSSVRALRNLKLGDLADFIFLHHALSRLNSKTVNYFEINRHSDSVPQYEELTNFIKLRVKTLGSANLSGLPDGKEAKNYKFKVPGRTFTIKTRKANKPSDCCKYCRRLGHQIGECQSFTNINPKDRYSKVKELKLCYNCLASDHGVRNCSSTQNCDKCEFQHHSLIHYDRSEDKSISPATTKDEKVSLYSTQVEEKVKLTTVLLGTVRVEVESSGGRGDGRFLLDNGSQANLVSRSFCKKLGLPISKFSSSIQGLGEISQPVRGVTTFTVHSKFKGRSSFPVTAMVVEKITGRLPQSQVKLRSNKWLEDLPLADITFAQPGAIEGIFGAEIFAEILGSDHRVEREDGLIATETSLGYVVMGRVPTVKRERKQRMFLSILENPSIEELVHRFWEVESVPEAKDCSADDQQCEEIFRREFSRDETGRFTVALPFKTNPSQLGDSRSGAKKRFFALEARLEKNMELKEAYHKAMADFVNQGHMTPVKDYTRSSAYYIPHHAVHKTNSESTPVRIVLDASAPSDNGVSLNSVLHIGPKLQTDIIEILINFRLFPVAVVSDIRQMYRQIKVVQPHHRFQRLYWRWDPREPLETWELRTLAFGVTSSPYLALRCIKELLQRETHNFPKTVALVQDSLYMDDLVISVPSLEESVELFSESVELFKRGQFELTKWATNSEKLLEEIPVKMRAKGDRLVSFGSETSILGMVWDPGLDKILIKFPVPATECTKRSILSSISRCFDPLGLMAPLTLYLKVLVKELWSAKLSWDETAPQTIQRRWKKVHAEWSSIRKLKIERSFGAERGTFVNLLGFADASKNGYGGVIYLQKTEGDARLWLTCAKSRVSPMKVMSIPRLELSAALLLIKLMSYVLKTLSKRIKFADIFAFSDSTTVLQWLSGETSKDTFVRNRVTLIKSVLPGVKWRHIAGKDNPADGLSRGLSPAQLVDHNLWFEGPLWATLEKEKWPCLHFEPVPEAIVGFTAVPEMVKPDEEHPLLKLVSRKSSWSEILRITVWVLRWLKLLPKQARITVSDLEIAEETLIRLVQGQYFADDLERLLSGKELSNRLRKLQPFLHKEVLRVGGRLSSAKIPFNQCHQFILPKKCRLTERIIDYYHLKYLHSGAYLVEAFLRQRYWILGGKSAIKKRVRACNRCFRCDPKSLEARMGDLPEYRVTPAKAFLKTGVDYFGPINITLGRRRGAAVFKAYVALFVCMSVKAIHLELVSSLSTDHFLQAFKRFLARRGPCIVLYSDRGTNFMGAKRVLTELGALVSSNEYNKVIGNELLHRKVDWKFIPAAAPHMGGLWESQVKVVKRHLLRVIGDQLLSYEELNTLLVQIEGLLNSRPLCQLSTDPSAPSALTPAHFLHQVPLEFLPAEELSDDNLSRLNRFQLLDQMVQSFWRRWSLEYLTTLQVRQKWNRNGTNVKVGTVVLLKMDNTPVLQWPLGVITEVFPGCDGTVRSVRLRCGRKELVRPVVKICPLPSQ